MRLDSLAENATPYIDFGGLDVHCRVRLEKSLFKLTPCIMNLSAVYSSVMTEYHTLSENNHYLNYLNNSASNNLILQIWIAN